MSDEPELWEQVPDHVPDDIELFSAGEGKIKGRDEYGEFNIKPMTGASEPSDGRCNAVVRHSLERYGETRYCQRLPANKFPGYESDYCKLHRNMEGLEAQWENLFEHGYYAETYVHMAKKLSPTKFLFAIEMLGGLFEMSQYEFQVEENDITLDTSDSPLIMEDAVEVSMPIPTTTEYSFQADQLWQAALSEVEMRQMREVIFEDGLEKESYSSTADVDGEITDTLTEREEHHLHLPISRLTKDVKEHLKNGGVEIAADDESGVVTFQQNDYTLDISPDEETDSDDAEEISEVAEDFTDALNGDEDTVM